MIAAANWARTRKIPYLGICLGMQIAVIEYARNVAGLEGRSSIPYERVWTISLNECRSLRCKF